MEKLRPAKLRNLPNADYEACYPYEYNIDTVNYNYMHHAETEVAQYASHPNIRFYRQDPMYGKTLEYDIMRENPNCELLLTDSVSNISEIKAMMAEQNLIPGLPLKIVQPVDLRFGLSCPDASSVPRPPGCH